MSISQYKKTGRSGFTLIELLVVIAIIGVLVGLLLPAVQQAREAARRSACTNKLKQMGLAALNYESTNKKLPAAFRTEETYAIQGNDTNTGQNGNHRWSFVLNILPYLEQLPLHQNMISKITSTAGYRPWSGTNGQKSNGADTVNTELTELLCPSDPNGGRFSGGGETKGRTNYRINRGDIRMDNGGNNTKFPRAPGYAGWTGWNASRKEQKVQFKNITDGTSNSIMFGEARIGDLSGDSRAGGWGVASMGNVNAAQATCDALIGAGGQYTTPNTGSPNQQPGCRWADGEEGYTQFFTFASPNSPRCAVNGEGWQCNPASSYHPGGAVMTHIDGSVAFYNDNIDDGDRTQGQTKGTDPQTGWHQNTGYSGASQRGIIGALGSMNGGEVASTP